MALIQTVLTVCHLFSSHLHTFALPLGFIFQGVNWSYNFWGRFGNTCGYCNLILQACKPWAAVLLEVRQKIKCCMCLKKSCLRARSIISHELPQYFLHRLVSLLRGARCWLLPNLSFSVFDFTVVAFRPKESIAHYQDVWVHGLNLSFAEIFSHLIQGIHNIKYGTVHLFLLSVIDDHSNSNNDNNSNY